MLMLFFMLLSSCAIGSAKNDTNRNPFEEAEDNSSQNEHSDGLLENGAKNENTTAEISISVPVSEEESQQSEKNPLTTTPDSILELSSASDLTETVPSSSDITPEGTLIQEILSDAHHYTNNDLNYHDFSRDNVEKIVAQPTFGYGTDEYIITSVFFVYQNEDIKAKYGTDFILDPADVKDGGVGYGVRLFGIYKGEGVCTICLGEDLYNFFCEKDYMGKWHVNSYELDTDPIQFLKDSDLVLYVDDRVYIVYSYELNNLSVYSHIDGSIIKTEYLKAIERPNPDNPSNVFPYHDDGIYYIKDGQEYLFYSF